MTKNLIQSKKGTVAIFFLLLVVSVTGCKKGTDIKEEITVDENGYVDVYTNNSSLCNYLLHIDTEDLTSFMQDSIATEVIKITGFTGGYLGLYFNGSLDSQNALTNFCAVMINNEGSYMVFRCVNGTYTFLNGSGSWVSDQYAFASSYIDQGYNKSNQIKVKVAGANTYNLYLNKHLVNTFTESSLTSGVKKGYMFIVGSQEEEGFPDEFLHIKLKEVAAH